MDDVRAEILAHDDVPRGTLEERYSNNVLLTILLVHVLLYLICDESLLAIVLEGLVNILYEFYSIEGCPTFLVASSMGGSMSITFMLSFDILVFYLF